MSQKTLKHLIGKDFTVRVHPNDDDGNFFIYVKFGTKWFHTWHRLNIPHADYSRDGIRISTDTWAFGSYTEVRFIDLKNPNNMTNLMNFIEEELDNLEQNTLDTYNLQRVRGISTIQHD